MTSPSLPVPTLSTLSDGLAEAAERAGRAVVAIAAVAARRRRLASGVLWRPGVVVAANHLLDRDGEHTVLRADGTTATATLAGRDPGTDLAVLRLPENGAAAPEFGDAGALRVGNLALALGRSPRVGLIAGLALVGAVGGEWRTWHGGRIDRLIRLDVRVGWGFSGGPLVDTEGRILGLNTAGLGRDRALTIPAATVERVLGPLLEGRGGRRGYLGLALQPVELPAAARQALGSSADTGLIVVGVEPGGPADRAGLLLGDVLVALGETAVGDPADLAPLLDADRIGSAVEARLMRAGQPLAVPVTIGERPRQAEA